MKSIYIGGDSFCYYRSATDWPGLVASTLKLTLQGQGFPGDSWWHTRQHLIAYLATAEANKTDTFIFCHTDPYRPLTGQQFFKNPEAEAVKQQYFKYFVDYDVSLWTTQQWYLELNQLLAGRQVLHFQSFASSQEPFKLLAGTRVATPLVDLSLGNNEWATFMNDTRRNHFDAEQNRLFAQLAVKCLSSKQTDLDISWNS